MSMFAITNGGRGSGGSGSKTDDITARTRACISNLRKSQMEMENRAKIQQANFKKTELECKEAFEKGEDDEGDRLLDLCVFYKTDCLQYKADVSNLTKKICELERHLTTGSVSASLREIRSVHAASLLEESLQSARQMLNDFNRVSNTVMEKTNMTSAALASKQTEASIKARESMKEMMMDKAIINNSATFGKVPLQTTETAEDLDEKDLQKRFQALKNQ